MALPMVISMLVNSLYNIVDSYFVARISEEAMTALSLVFPIQNLINAVTIGFGIGVNAVIAYHLGANELERADRAASQGADAVADSRPGPDRGLHFPHAPFFAAVHQFGQRRRSGRALCHGGLCLCAGHFL